jgi:hypothetical protein
MFCPLENLGKNVVGIAQEHCVARGEELGAGIARSHLRELVSTQARQAVIDAQRGEECLGEVEKITHADCLGCANGERVDENLLVVESETVDE